MQFHTDGKTFKAVYITGPTHNYLGLALAENGDKEPVVVEPLTLNTEEPARLDAAEVREWVSRGVESANNELATHYRLKRIEFVASDSLPAAIYEQLACRIIKRLHAQPTTFNGTSDESLAS